MEALNAWRDAGKKTDEPASAKSSKKVKFQDVQDSWKQQQDPKKKGSFFANIEPGQSEFNLNCLPTWQEGGTQPDKKFSSKESCWQCYKLYSLTIETSAFKQGEKGFCSQICYDKFTAANTIKCQFVGCGKCFLKTDGHFAHGKWFCSENHCNNDPEIQKIEEMQAKLKASKLSAGAAEAGDGGDDDDDEEEVAYEI